MNYQQLIDKYGNPNPYVTKVHHPLSDLKMPIASEPFIAQPVHERGEVSAEIFVHSQDFKNRNALASFIKDAGPEFWIDKGLLAVGTKLFPPSYWKGVAKDAARGREKEYTPILAHGGEDLDLVLLAKVPEPARASNWIQKLSNTLTRAGVRYDKKDGYENGALYEAFTLEIEKHPTRDEEVAYLDELPYRHKIGASGTSVIVYYDNASPIHIRQNFAASAERIIDAERRMGFTFAELFQDGKYGKFLKLLES